MSKIQEKWKNFLNKTEPGQSKSATTFRNIGKVIAIVCRWLYRLRSILLSIPVIALAVEFALENKNRLPDAVGINLLESGEFAYYVTKDVAVMGPLAVTAVCLLLMFCSRRVLYPWLIALCSLALPWLVYITNVFPA